ncbi:MAG: FtsX-like permease family protein [Bryobacteraceae bacterium]
MTSATLVRRGLLYHLRTNLAVISGVAVAVAVLAGAFLVGDSVRSSLRRLALERIGNTQSAVAATHLFRESLADAFGDACPILVLEGIVTHQASGRRAAGVAVYGVDDRFWKFHGRPSLGLGARDAALSHSLAAELGSAPGETILLRLEKPTDIPAESLFGRKEDAAPTFRFDVKSVLAAAALGEFSLRPSQGAVRAIFVPLSRLQRDIGAPARVNTILAGKTAAPVDQILDSAWAIDDLGLRVRTIPDADAVQFESSSGVIADSTADTASRVAASLGLKVTPVLSYMATAIRAGDRETDYALIAAIDLAQLDEDLAEAPENAIVVNEWAARDLALRPGMPVTLEYLYWRDDGRLTTEKAEFEASRIVPIEGLAADRALSPEYPGITDAENVADWDPPFPVDLSKIGDRDEDYWDRYRATPKAWIPLARGQKLWQTRWGKVTALRLEPPSDDDEALQKAATEFRRGLRAALKPESNGLTVIPLRARNEEASRGATDFGEYFSYFSFFLMMSALLLAALFFRLGIEQRYSEIGLLRAIGFAPARIRRLFLAEGAILALIGALIGAFGAVAYAWAILYGLGSWWSGAVGTNALTLHLSPAPLAGGVAGGIFASLLAIVLTLRGVKDWSPRALLAGAESAPSTTKPSRAKLTAAITGALAVALLAAGAAKAMPAAGAFFGGGMLALIALLAAFRAWLANATGRLVRTRAALAVRNLSYRPGRTILSASLVAAATFLIVSVEAFRRDPHALESARNSGTGGFPLIAESVRPIYFNPNTARAELNLPENKDLRFVPLRLKPGDDASCLNLYQPQNPRIVGVPEELIRENRFAFASGDGANPWTLLDQTQPGGAIPAIADANSLQYVLHKSIGDELTLPTGQRLRFVASLADSVFQSEILISERNFVRAFPAQQGFRMFLIEAPAAGRAELVAEIESALADHGLDVTATSERLAAFHRVENTYLSTFQSLGALGLLLGTLGLAAVLFRNVYERRREFGLLAAVGYSRAELSRLVITENVALLLAALAIGAGTAALAIAPVLASRGAQFSLLSMAALLAAVFAAGLLATLISVRLALRLPLLASLRAG